MVYRIEERLSFEVNRAAAAAAAAADYDQRRKPPLKSFMMCSYFNVRGLLFMSLFTVSLLLMPLILPPLPPPPLMLLFVPVAIMAVLLFLAFTPPQQLPNVAFNSM